MRDAQTPSHGPAGSMSSSAGAALFPRSAPARMRNGVLTTAALANALAWTPFAGAQTPAGPTGDLEELPGATQMPEVVVRGQQDAAYRAETLSSPRYTEPLRDIPQTIEVIPQEVIQDQNATTLRDVLRNVPGISVQAGEGGVTAGDNLSIRGFSARTDLFVDGVRDIGGYTRDPFNYEQVEVVKGPASSYSGRGSTGGSINLVTKTPRAEASYAGTAGIGTDNYKRFTLDLNQPVSFLWPRTSGGAPELGAPGDKSYIPAVAGDSAPTVAVRLNAMWTESDVANRNEVGGRRWGVAPSIAFGLGTPTQITLTYSHLDQDNVPDYGIPWVPDSNLVLADRVNQPAPVDFSNFYGLLSRDYEKTITDIGSLEIEHAFNDTSTLRYLFHYGRNERDSIITAPRFVSPTSTDIRRQLQDRDQVETILSNTADFTTHFDTWGAAHTLVMGAEYAHETSERHRRSGPEAPVADLHHPDPFQDYDGTIARDGRRTGATTDNVAIYAFDTIELGRHWELSGGLRWDYFDAELQDRAIDGTVANRSRLDKVLSWRTGLVYKPVENGSLYAAYGTSFNPSAEQLTLNAAEENLEPEESRTYELGTKWDLLEGRLALSAAVFRVEKTNARTDGIDPLEPVVLEGEQRVDGLELGVSGRITEDWSVFAAYTFLDSEIESSGDPLEVGNDLPNTPQHSFSLWTVYALPWNLEIGAGAQYVGERFSNASNARVAPDYWLFDAMLAYKVNENVTARLNVHNLADEEYIDRVGGGHFLPGPGRSASLTLSFDF